MHTEEYYREKGFDSQKDYYENIKWEDCGYISPPLSSEDVAPDYISAEVEESIKSIKTSQCEGSITFGFMTDLHYATTHNHEIRMKRMLNAYRKISECVSVNALLLGGDYTNEGCKEYKTNCFRELKNQFSDIDYLPANGNHDDGSIWDISYIKADKAVNHLTKEDRWNLFYSHLPDKGIKSEKNKLYYFYDCAGTKTRYICLDVCEPPEVMENGKICYSAQWNFAMSQQQVDWFVNEALNFKEEGWKAVIWMHAVNPPASIAKIYENSSEQWYLEHINHIVDAYKTGVNINTQYYNNEFKISVKTHFSNVTKADIIGLFVGNFHRDIVDYTSSGVPVIFTANSVTYRGGTDRVERNDGDKTEILFDIITVDKESRNIHITRVGAGENRELKY